MCSTKQIESAADDNGVNKALWLIQTELMWERDRDQNRSLYIMLNLHTATYVGT